MQGFQLNIGMDSELGGINAISIYVLKHRILVFTLITNNSTLQGLLSTQFT